MARRKEQQSPEVGRERQGDGRDNQERDWERPMYGQERQGYGRERQGQDWERPMYGQERQGQGRERQGQGWERQGREWSSPEYGGQGETYSGGQYAGRGPKGYQRSDERIREDVCDRLTAHPQLDASEIEVEVHDSEVTLKGTVNERNAKRIAEDVAEAVSGVKEVHNQIRVTQGQQSERMQTREQNYMARTTV